MHPAWYVTSRPVELNTGLAASQYQLKRTGAEAAPSNTKLLTPTCTHEDGQLDRNM
jgi:hypothetical protein